jgi:type I restriction enzyme S subunit
MSKSQLSINNYQLPEGYKQTEIGVIPEDWDVKTIKELSLDISDGNYSSKYPRSDEFKPVGVPFIRGNNLHNMTVIDDDLRFISHEKHHQLLKGHLKKGDILITTRGDIGQISFVPDRHIGSNINAQLVRINTDRIGIENNYFAYFLVTTQAVAGVIEDYPRTGQGEHLRH